MFGRIPLSQLKPLGDRQLIVLATELSVADLALTDRDLQPILRHSLTRKRGGQMTPVAGLVPQSPPLGLDRDGALVFLKWRVALWEVGWRYPTIHRLFRAGVTDSCDEAACACCLQAAVTGAVLV